jgi:sigma-E factor negative regulatory protein RseC
MSDCQKLVNVQMVEAIGHVTQVAEGRATVEIQSRGCGRCYEPGGCGGQSLTQLTAKPTTFVVANTIDAHLGEQVSLRMAQSMVQKAAISAYVIPLLLCILGALIGQAASGDLMASMGALIGIIMGWWIIRFQSFRSGEIANQTYIELRRL